MEDGDLCAICLVEMGGEEDESKQGVYTLPECGHRFHADCIVLYLRSGSATSNTNSRCPLCRRDPKVLLKKQDVMQRAKMLIERFNRNDDTLEPEMCECARRIATIDLKVKLARENIAANVRNNELNVRTKEGLLTEYRKLRDEFRRKSRPIMKQIEGLQDDNARRRRRLNRILWEAKKSHRNEMRRLGLMGL